MNFNIGGPSNTSFQQSSSSSSNDEDDDYFINDLSQSQLLAFSKVQNNNNFLESQNTFQNPTRRGSIPGHIVINQHREVADHELLNNYFTDAPTYCEKKFRRRYRMSRNLFLRIVEAIKHHDPYFEQRSDGLGRLGLSTLQKVTTVFWMLTYAMPADATDEIVKIGESTAIECLKRFCRAIIEVFAERYLRSPNANDTARLLHIGEERGFPGMLGSLDCMHWEWKNCPTGWAGQYSGHSGKSSIILEAVADYDLWIWHAYFGMPGTNNDINVLESSHLFFNLSQSIASPAHYNILGKEYDMGYYLADGIYPKWSTLVQTIHKPVGPKKQYFARKQEACRKDVERAFGVLQSRFSVVAGPARFWKKNVLHDIITACIIMHNMLIEDERNLNANISEVPEAPAPTVTIADDNIRFQEFIARHRKIKDKNAHIELRNALIEHLWVRYTNSEDL